MTYVTQSIDVLSLEHVQGDNDISNNSIVNNFPLGNPNSDNTAIFTAQCTGVQGDSHLMWRVELYDSPGEILLINNSENALSTTSENIYQTSLNFYSLGSMHDGVYTCESLFSGSSVSVTIVAGEKYCICTNLKTSYVLLQIK